MLVKDLRGYINKQEKIDLVLDTDAYNETDDQFTIAYMLQKLDKINLKAIIAAPFKNAISYSAGDGMRQSYREIKNILSLCGRKDLYKIAYKGSRRFLKDEDTPVISRGALKLIELSKGYSIDHPLFVVAIGAITNIASAIILDPSITDRIALVWLGGSSHENGPREFNLRQDVAAARICMSAPKLFVQVPCKGVTDEFRFSKDTIFSLLDDNAPIGHYLKQIFEKTMIRENQSNRVIWDVVALSYILNKDNVYLEEEVRKLRLPSYELSYEEPIDKDFIYVTKVHKDVLFNDLITSISKYSKIN